MRTVGVRPGRRNSPRAHNFWGWVWALRTRASALSFFVSSAWSDEVSNFQPKSPAAAGLPADWSCDSSQKAQYATICAHPAAGTSSGRTWRALGWQAALMCNSAAEP